MAGLLAIIVAWLPALIKEDNTVFGIENLFLFIVSGILLNLIPGPDSLLIVGRAATQGFKAGSAAALGVGSGTFLHILAATFGLSAILATSSIAFTVVKICGAVYLLYMALSIFRDSAEQKQMSDIRPAKASLQRVYAQGLITNLFNPKVAIFFLAFMPQFISESSDSKALAFLLLGFIFNLNAMIWCHFIAWVSSVSSKKLAVSQPVRKWLLRVSAGLFAALGLRLLVSSQS
ncbi:LysE family translocator [Zhongshania arctica]|uniref:LysE family translocator n=1 Tax=Zhongshania arctica TaxID=3238302 RepID=A0ABV3TWR2_9GAMM